MKVVIENCFHWLGFHLTGTYLDKGYSIIGIDPLDDPKKEFLYDFFGRNSEFIFLTASMQYVAIQTRNF